MISFPKKLLNLIHLIILYRQYNRKMCRGQLFELTPEFKSLQDARNGSLSPYLFIPLLISKNYPLFVTEGDINATFEGYQHLCSNGHHDQFHGYFESLGNDQSSDFRYNEKSRLYFTNNNFTQFKSIHIAYRLNFPYNFFRHQHTLKKVFGGDTSDITMFGIHKCRDYIFSIYTSEQSDEIIILPENGGRRIKSKNTFMKKFPMLSEFFQYL